MKDFVKLIERVHAERFSVVTSRLVTQKIPVAFLSSLNISEAVDTVKNFRAQGLNITTLIVTTTSPPPADIEFDVVNLAEAAKIYPKPEYVWIMNSFELNFAKKFAAGNKIILPSNIRTSTTEQVYETFMAHLDDLREVYESLIDEESKKTFRGYWLGCISNQLSEIVYASTPQYICTGFIPENGAIVIDCGAYDGGTAARFAKMGCKVYAFEPGKDIFDVARKAAEENNFVAENLGLGSFKHNATFTQAANPGASKIDANGTEIVRVTTLDAYVRENDLPRVDFIKLDVEGAELDVLKGAATTIARFKPILALSAYHKWDDFWTLMNFVKSIRPNYEFAMRQFVISKEDGSYHFFDGMEENLDALGLRPAICGFGECVLFAR